MATLLGEAFVIVRPELTKFGTELSEGVGSAVSKTESASSGSFDRLASVGKAAFIGIAGAAIGFGAAAIDAALKGQEATAQLANAVTNAGGNWDSLKGHVDEVTQSYAKFGITNDEAESALTRLVQITNNVGQSEQLLATAANLAAARHIDLTTAANLVGRAAEGNITPLKRMGITVADTGSAAGNAQAAIALLNDRFGGAAQAQADTYAGKLKAFRAETENLEEKIGNLLLPVLAGLAGDLGDVIGFFEKNRVAAEALGVAVGGPLVVAIGAFIVKEGILVAERVADFFLTAGRAVVTFGTAMASAVTGISNGAVALGVAGLAVGGFAAGFAYLISTVQGAQAAANKWAQQFTQAAGAPQAAIDADKIKIEELQRELDHSGALAHIPFARMAVGAQQTEDKIHGLKGEVTRLTAEQQGNIKTANDNAVALGYAGDSAGAAGTQIDQLGESTHLTSVRTQELVDKLGLDLAKTALPDATAKVNALSNELSFGSAKSQNLHDAFAKLADATATATDKASAFKTALDILIGGNIDAEKAVVNFQASVDGLSTKLRANKDSFDAATEAGRNNITAVEDSVVAIRNHIEALKNQGASADQLQAAFDGDTGALRRQLEQAGLTKGQIDSLIQSYGLVPSTLHTVITADFSQAYAAAAQFAQNFKALFDAGIPAPLRGKVLGRGAYFPGGHPELAVVGDTREVVLPLDDPKRMAELLSQAGVGRSGPSSSGPAAVAVGEPSVHVDVNINMPGLATSPEAQQLIRSVAHGEFSTAMTEVLDRAAAGAGTRGG